MEAVEVFLMFIVGLALSLLVTFGEAAALYYVWNWLAGIYGWPHVSFFLALCILVLLNVITYPFRKG